MADPYYQQQQHYRHPDPKTSGYRDENAHPRRYNDAPSEASTYDPSHFPPPPRTERGHDERSVTESYAGSEARNGQALAPYDDEKAYAQYSDAYGAPDYGRRSQAAPSEYGRSQAAPSEYGGRRSHPPPQSDYDRNDRRRDDDRRYDDRPRRNEPRERRRNSRPPSSDDSYSDDDTYDRDYDRRHRGSRPPIEDGKGKEKKSRLERGKELFRSGEGERGLGATLLGAAGGAFLGDQIANKNGKGKGKGSKGETALSTIGGALVGAIGANAAERQIGKIEKEKEGGKEGKDKAARRSYMDEYATGGDDPYGGSAGRGQSREDRSRGVDEFRPKRADRRGEPRRRRRRDRSSDSYTSDE